jgi:1-acyl-sn-glycerol-3-phosphate acyltransferase
VTQVRADDRIPLGMGRSQPALKRVAGPLLHWYYRMRVVGAELVPGDGPAIIAANHRSMRDPPILIAACPRPLICMAAQGLFQFALLRPIWRELGGFPVDRRSAGVPALQVALGLLERGHAVCVFPEGRRNLSDRLLPFHGGPAWLAVRTGAPIVPCALSGTGRSERHGRRLSVHVTFGDPLLVQPVRDVAARRVLERQVTSRLVEAVAAMLGQRHGDAS